MMGVSSVILVLALVVTLLLQGNLVSTQASLLTTQKGLLASLPVSVTNLDDHGPGSLREAIKTSIPGAAITFSRNLHGTILLTSGDLKITQSLIISGSGASRLAISAGKRSRVFLVTNDAHVTISNLTIEYGNAGHIEYSNATSIKEVPKTGDVSGCGDCGPKAANDFAGVGGGIYNDVDSTLTLFGCVVTSNTADEGAGIENNGVLYLLIGKSPDLGPMQNNGGLTQTYALLPGSPAIDRVPYSSSGICGLSAPVRGVANDQRGMKRPDGSEKACDIGAYESSY